MAALSSILAFHSILLFCSPDAAHLICTAIAESQGGPKWSLYLVEKLKSKRFHEEEKKTFLILSPHLLGTVLLDAVVDATESGSGQHKGSLLVDERVEVSFDLENQEVGRI